MGQALDPASVTAALGLEPDTAHARGAPASSRGTTYDSGLWLLTSEDRVRSGDLADHLAWLLDRIEPSEEALTELQEAEGFDSDFFCFWVSEHGHGGPSLPAGLLGRIARVGAGLDFDVYFAGE